MSPAETPRSTAEGQPPAIYISYSHRDSKLLEQLLRHLAPLESSGLIQIFYDAQLAVGDEWEPELLRRLHDASAVLFLVSPASLASTFIEREMHLALSEETSKLVIPVILRPCDWQSSPLAKFQVLPRQGKPVTTWRVRDQAWHDVVEQIKGMLASSARGGQPSPPSRHTAAVRRLVIAPDGGRAISTSDDNTAIAWDLSSMRPVVRLAGHTGPVTDVDFSVDGRRVITSSRDASIKVWAPDVVFLTITGISDEPYLSLATLADGIVSVSAATMEVWTETGESRARIDVPNAAFTDVVAGQRGAAVVSAHEDGSCRLWRLPDLRLDQQQQIATAAIRQIRWLPGDGDSYLCCSDDGSIHVFDFKGTNRTLQISGEAVTGVAALPDGRHAVAACSDGRLKLFDLSTGAVVRDLEVRSDSPSAVAVTADGSRAIWGSRNGGVSAWPLDTSVKQPLPTGRDRLRLAYLAVLEEPELWPVLETLEEATLSGIGEQLSLPPESDVLQYLIAKYPGVEPPALWAEWMELQPDKLGKNRQ